MIFRNIIQIFGKIFWIRVYWKKIKHLIRKIAEMCIFASFKNRGKVYKQPL